MLTVQVSRHFIILAQYPGSLAFLGEVLNLTLDRLSPCVPGKGAKPGRKLVADAAGQGCPGVQGESPGVRLLLGAFCGHCPDLFVPLDYYYH